MGSQKPLFVDFTWGAGGSTSDLTLELTTLSQKEYGLQANMHLTCTNMEKSKIDGALAGAKAAGVRNIVALRGDPPHGQESWSACEGGFSCALDLVNYIRAQHGDFFGISVAGYPEGHPNVIKPVNGRQLSESEKLRVVTMKEKVDLGDGKSETKDTHYVCSDEDFEKEMDYLKRKVDAGADFIITQMFFDTRTFLAFTAHCRRIGITAPVLPGIMFATNYRGFGRMTNMCKSRVPASMWAELEAIKDDKEAVEAYGIRSATDLCKKLLASGVPGLHFYTLNKTGPTYGVLQNIGRFRQTTAPISPLQEAVLKGAAAFGLALDTASLDFTLGVLSSASADDGSMTKGTIFS